MSSESGGAQTSKYLDHDARASWRVLLPAVEYTIGPRLRTTARKRANAKLKANADAKAENGKSTTAAGGSSECNFVAGGNVGKPFYCCCYC